MYHFPMGRLTFIIFLFAFRAFSQLSWDTKQNFCLYNPERKVCVQSLLHQSIAIKDNLVLPYHSASFRRSCPYKTPAAIRAHCLKYVAPYPSIEITTQAIIPLPEEYPESGDDSDIIVLTGLSEDDDKPTSININDDKPKKPFIESNTNPPCAPKDCYNSCVNGVKPRCKGCSNNIVEILQNSCKGRCAKPQQNFLTPNWSFYEAASFMIFCEQTAVDFCKFLNLPVSKNSNTTYLKYCDYTSQS